ncbi:MAG: hypothetical protein HOM96_05000, partial [Rickettsiales bacterium]|nr:hypothetical protein [Rickettsiales bacterium]
TVSSNIGGGDLKQAQDGAEKPLSNREKVLLARKQAKEAVKGSNTK